MPDITISLDQIKDLHRALLSAGETDRATSLKIILDQHEPPKPVIPDVIENYAEALSNHNYELNEGYGESSRASGFQLLNATKELHAWLATVLPKKD